MRHQAAARPRQPGRGILARAFSQAADVARMKARNLALYGNRIGPAAQQLFDKYGSWEAVISAATRTAGLSW
jgi:AAA+ superfamily predicted ATPase